MGELLGGGQKVGGDRHQRAVGPERRECNQYQQRGEREPVRATPSRP